MSERIEEVKVGCDLASPDGDHSRLVLRFPDGSTEVYVSESERDEAVRRAVKVERNSNWHKANSLEEYQRFITSAFQHRLEALVGEAMKKRDDLYKETNVKKLLEQMEEDLLEYGQYHEPHCLQMSEWADPDSECDCVTIKAMRSFATKWVGKTNEMWVQNLMHHRQTIKQHITSVTKIK